MPELCYGDELIQAYTAAAGGLDKYLQIVTHHNSAAPIYNPKAVQAFLKIANCYDYAMNDLDFVGSNSVPGGKLNVINAHLATHGNETEFTQYIEQNKLGVQLDGAIFLSPQRIKCMETTYIFSKLYLVAMYAKPTSVTDPNKYDDGNGFDFHFIRQNNDGTFSHKSGSLSPTNLDKSGKLITDPMRADMGDYKFAGFFLVPKNGLDVGDGPKYNNINNVSLTPERRRELDAVIIPKSQIEDVKKEGNPELYKTTHGDLSFKHVLKSSPNR